MGVRYPDAHGLISNQFVRGSVEGSGAVFVDDQAGAPPVVDRERLHRDLAAHRLAPAVDAVEAELRPFALGERRPDRGAQVWQMLWLRHQARTKTPGPAAAILSDGQQEALRALCATLPAQADAQQTLIAIAKLGGYFGRKSDGPPGWRTIWKGFQYLTTYAEGFGAARNGSKATLREPS